MKYLALLLMLLASAARSLAQCQPQWLPGDSVPGMDGGISSHAVYDPDGPGPLPQTLYMAGEPEVAGPLVRPMGLWSFDGTTWTALRHNGGGTSPPRLLQYNNEVIFSGHSGILPGYGLWKINPSGLQLLSNQAISATIQVVNGQIYARGPFTIDGVNTVRGVARWTGAAWERLGPDFGAQASISYLTSYNGSLVMSGNFSLPNLGTRSIARWDGTRWVSMGSLDAPIQEAVEHDGSLYVRGNFNNAGNLGIAKLARWNGTAWSAVGGAPVGSVYAMRSYAGSLYIAGGFYSIGNFDVANLARWDGAAWHNLETGLVGDYASTLDVYQGDLIIGGRFTGAGHLTNTGSLVRWNGSSFLPLGNTEGIVGRCRMLCELNGELIAEGEINSAGGLPAYSLAAWNGETWRPLVPATGMHGVVYALTQYRDRLFAGGDFLYAGNHPVRGLGSYLNGAWSPVGSFGPNGNVYALAVHEDQLIAGGAFTDTDGLPAGNVARWDGAAWHAMGDGLAEGSVTALAVHAGNLMAAHVHLNDAGTALVAEVKTWDGAQWLAVGPEFNGYINALASNGVDLYSGGSFSSAGATPLSRVARWDGAAWNPLGAGVNQSVRSLTFHNAELVAAGDFTQAGGQAVGRWARWNGTAWIGLPFFQVYQTEAGAPLYSVISHNGLLIGGVGNSEAAYNGCVRQWNGSPIQGCIGWVDSDTTPFILAMTIYNNRLVMGGWFSNVNQTLSYNVAQAWIPSSDFNGDGDFGTDADIEAFFACLGGACCPSCGTSDFNSDGDFGTDADIEAFFRVLGGGSC